MRHRRTAKKLGRSGSARRGLTKNLYRSFFIHGKMTTTEAKAKAIKPVLEKLITTGKRNTLHARREIIKQTGSAAVAKLLLSDISVRYKDRNGGYLRITKLFKRTGDAAPMVIITYV
ncbi:MAG: 50S ribosomal protein L17 [Candidatus Kerfeldbacteria bacterium]|nr:50S ribosomal protein L17 [Candidatus Kerfeldbacteria bacterium]